MAHFSIEPRRRDQQRAPECPFEADNLRVWLISKAILILRVIVLERDLLGIDLAIKLEM